MYPSLAAVYAAALRQQIEAVTARGLYREYQRHEATTSFPHGRIDVHQTITQLHSRGIKHKMAISYFQRSIDNPVNRCLLYAVWRLNAYVGQVASVLTVNERRRAQRDLNACLLRLRGVQVDWHEGFLTDAVVTGAAALPTLRSYYRPALDLALAIIGRKALAFEKRGSRLELPSLVINMSDVFESYSRAVLARAAEGEGWAYEVLDGNRNPPAGIASTLFDGEDDVAIRITPDTVLRHRATKEVPVLIEVKYRPPKEKPKREDLEQAITYGVAYRARNLVLLQPQGEVAPAQNPHLMGTLSGMRVYRYLFDLGNPDIRGREQAFAAEMHALAAAP